MHHPPPETRLARRPPSRRPQWLSLRCHRLPFLSPSPRGRVTTAEPGVIREVRPLPAARAPTSSGLAGVGAPKLVGVEIALAVIVAVSALIVGIWLFGERPQRGSLVVSSRGMPDGYEPPSGLLHGPGVTFDLTYQIIPVTQLPTEPATPPSSPSGVSSSHVVRHCPGCRCEE